MLSIWGNYLSGSYQFRKISGITCDRKIDEMLSECQITRKFDYYYSGLARDFIQEIRNIIISGTLGTLNDRWNLWTFGIKVYFTNTHFSWRLLKHCHIGYYLESHLGKNNFILLYRIITYRETEVSNLLSLDISKLKQRRFMTSISKATLYNQIFA